MIPEFVCTAAWILMIAFVGCFLALWVFAAVVGTLQALLQYWDKK